MTQNEFNEKIKEIEGQLYIVGGWVRDQIMGRKPKDKDYAVTGITEKQFLSQFPSAQKVGNSFPVFLLDVEGEQCEVAFARREKKSGSGYHGFKVDFSPSTTIFDDLYRRDTTVNAMAFSIRSQDSLQLLDPYGGQEDIKRKRLHPVSEHFKDDPVRSLRAARQSAQFDFDISPKLACYMSETSAELSREAHERKFAEMEKALNSGNPSLFFENLHETFLLDVTFPWIEDLYGIKQPTKYHKGYDAFYHTLHVLREVSKLTTNPIARFCALTHDLGKGTTPTEMLPHHYGHEHRTVEVLDDWNSHMTLPIHWLKCAKFVGKHHMKAPRVKKKSTMVKIIMELAKLSGHLSFSDFAKILLVDFGEIPFYIDHANFLYNHLLEVKGDDAPKYLVGKQIGEWILQQRVHKLSKLIYDLQQIFKEL